MRVIDQVNSIYRGMFSIKFEHASYFMVNTDVICDAIKVLPDPQTQEIFSRYKMLYRFHGNLFICFIKCNIIEVPGDEPKSQPCVNFTAEDIQMRFLLHASTPFLKRTNITAAGARQVYHFNNQSNASINMVITGNGDGVDNSDLKLRSDINPADTCLAVIDIHTHITDSDYKIFDNELLLADNMPEYKIIFKKAM